MRLSVAVLWSAFLCLAGTASAGPSRSFQVTTYKDFAEGEAEGVVLSSEGEAQSGFAQTRLSMPALTDDSVRALAQAPDGRVYVGIGGEGPAVHVYERGTLRKLVRLDAATWVTALCVLPQKKGGDYEVLASTAQDGRIFALTPKGQARVFATLEAEHVWALLYDEKRDQVYAATAPGRLWAVSRGGTAARLFESGTKHVLSLALAEDGMVYIGTADDAVLYRVDPSRRGPGSVRAIHDFSGNELRALGHHRGTLFAAVNEMKRSETPTPRPGARIVPPAAGTAPGAGPGKGTPPSLPKDRQGKGALYRIDPDGRVEQMHAISDGFMNALAVAADGTLFAAASSPSGRGRVFAVRPDRTVLTAMEFKESDVLALSLGREQLVGTGNSAALYRVSDEPPAAAHYLSKVIDAEYMATWGSLVYSGEGALKLETRSGNLGKPDATWSPWAPLSQLGPSPTPSEFRGKVASPSGRYLQVRVGMGRRALLRDFTVYYQPMNQRARVTEIQIGEDPLGRLARGQKSTPQKPRQALVKLRWKVENPDKDELSYRLEVRRLPASNKEQPAWLRLGGQEPLTKTEFEWNTETVADGVYEARVTVSDEPHNPPENALTHEMIASPFVVDNTRPEFKDVRASPATLLVSGKVQDQTSPLLEISCSVDGGPPQPVQPADGVLDDLSEEFSFRLPPLPAGVHTVLLRATDSADNTAAAQLLVRIK